jgi:Zn-dependent peptidase ImmA (M78 family)
MKTRDIDSKATVLLEQVFGDVDSLELPVDLNRVIEFLRMEVREGSFKDGDIEGALDRNKRIIYLSEEDTLENKNFTTAHELGHFKLHDNVATDIFTMHQLERLKDCDMPAESDNEETEADYFALSLLMPKGLIEPLWKSARDIKIIAKIFGVPEFIARSRLKNLKLVK